MKTLRAPDPWAPSTLVLNVTSLLATGAGAYLWRDGHPWIGSVVGLLAWALVVVAFVFVLGLWDGYFGSKEEP